MALNRRTGLFVSVLLFSVYFEVVTSLQCYNCDSLSTATGCQKVMDCGMNEVCMLRRTIDNDTQAILYESRCETQTECDKELLRYQAILTALVGRKREVTQVLLGNVCLIQCCKHDLCNDGCVIPTNPPAHSAVAEGSSPKPPPPSPGSTHSNSLSTDISTEMTSKAILIPTKPTKLPTKMTSQTTTSSKTTIAPTTTTITTTHNSQNTQIIVQSVPTVLSTAASTNTTVQTSTVKSTSTPVPMSTQPLSKPDCPDGSMAFDNSCYMFVKREMSYHDAKNFCAYYHAHLVHVNTARENEFLKNEITKLQRGPTQYWIGITDFDTENVWKFYDNGNVATFFDWYPGEPDGTQKFDGNADADCAVFDPFLNFQWRDEDCSPYQSSEPICELER